MKAVHQSLYIVLCRDVQDAIEQGFNYRGTDIKPIEIKKIIVVRNGTEGGNPTVDFLLEDETGQQFVFMVTGRLLKSIPC